MAGIRGTNTRPEIAVRKALYARGFRYRLHSRTVPGRPDIALAKFGTAIFVNGCFWHGHDCSLFRLPDTRREFWAAKIARNRERDAKVRAELTKAGWRALTVWECAMRGKGSKTLRVVIDEVAAWLRVGVDHQELRGGLDGGR